MGWFEWLAQLAVATLLTGTILVGLRLERALRTVRGDREALAGCATELDEASRRAQAASVALRRDAEESRTAMQAGAAAAEPVRDDLRYLLQRAEAVADRLEELVRAARGLGASGGPVLAAVPGPAPSRPAESRAERELLAALSRRVS